MRREDREAMRGKTQEGGRKKERGGNATPEFERMDREQMRGQASNEREQQRPERPSGRLPLPD